MSCSNQSISQYFHSINRRLINLYIHCIFRNKIHCTNSPILKPSNESIPKKTHSSPRYHSLRTPFLNHLSTLLVILNNLHNSMSSNDSKNILTLTKLKIKNMTLNIVIRRFNKHIFYHLYF